MKKQHKAPIIKYSSGDVISIYIYGEISQPSDYIEELETIRNARSTDDIIMYFNTPGGDMETAISFISAMEYSQANITGVIDGLCASAGSLIFLAAHSFEVSRGSSMLIHAYSSWVSGKRGEVLSQVAFHNNLYNKLFEDIYLGFLTGDEIIEVNKSHDLWLNAQEIADRCQKLIDYRMSKVLEEKKEEKEEKEDLKCTSKCIST